MNTEKGRPSLPTATPAVVSEGQDRDEAEGQPPQPAHGQRGHPSQQHHGHEHHHATPDHHQPPSHPQLQHQGQREYQSAPAAPPVPVQPSARQRVDLFASQLSSGARALPVDAARCIATVAERVASHKGFMATLTQITRDEIGQQRSAARTPQVPATQQLAAPINHPHQSPHQQQARRHFDDDDDEAVDVQAPQRNAGPRNGGPGFPQLNPGVLDSDVSRPGVGSGNLGGLGGFGARRGAPSSWSSQAAASPVTRGSHDSLDSFAVLGGTATPHATTPPQAKATLNDDPDPAIPGLQNDGGVREMATEHDSMHAMPTVVREPPVAREVTFMTPGSTPPIAVPCPTSEAHPHPHVASFENTPLKVATPHHSRPHASAHKGAGTPMSAGASVVGSEWDVVETCDSAVAFEHAQWWSASSTDVGDASHVQSTSDHPAASAGAFFAGSTSASHAQQRDHHGHHHRHHHRDRSPHASKLGGGGHHSSPAPSGCPLPLHPGGVSGTGACTMSATGASLQSDQQIRTAAECEVFSTLSERPESSSEGVQSCAGRHDALSPTMTALTNDNQNEEEIDATRTLQTHHTPEEIDRSDVASPTSSSFNVSNVVMIPDQGADADAVPMPRPVAQTKTRPPMPVGLRRSIDGSVTGAAQEGVVEGETSTGVLSSQQWDTASSDVFLTQEETTVFETNAVETSLSDTLPPPSSSTSTAVGGGSFATAAVGVAAAAAAVGVAGMAAANATATGTAPVASSDDGRKGTHTTPSSTHSGTTRPATTATATPVFVDPSNLPPPPPPPRDRVLAKAVHPSAHAHNAQSVNAADPDHALKHGGPISATPTRQPPQVVPTTALPPAPSAETLTATPPPSVPSDEPPVHHRSVDAAQSKNDFEPPASVVASLWGALLSIADELAGPGDDHADGVAAYGRRPDRSHDRHHHAEPHGEGSRTSTPPAVPEPAKTSAKTRASTKMTKTKTHARSQRKSRHADALWREGEFGGACDDVTLNSDHHFTASSTETQSMAGSRTASDIFPAANANGDLVMGSAPTDAVNVNADECLNEGECGTDLSTDEDGQTDQEAEAEETMTTTNSDNTATADRGASVPPSADRVFDSPSSLRHSAQHPMSVPESHHSTSLIHHEHNERRASPSTLSHVDAPAGEFLEAPDERFIIASALLVNAAVAYYLTTGTGLGGIMEAVVETIQSAFEGASGRAVRRVAGEAGSRVLQISGI